jgi:AraC-like DNA-binding protein
MTKQDRRWWFSSHVTAGYAIALGSVAAAVSGSLWLDISAVGASPHRGRRPVATRARSASGGDRQRRPNYESYEHSNPRVTDNRPVPVRHLATHRYLIGRRLERVKAEIARGCPLAESAYDAGFADQSHMTRHFKARFGLTPGRYLALVRGRARKTVSRCAPSRRRTVSQGDARPGLR